MNYIQIDQYKTSYKDVQQIVDTLKKGGIIVFPTDSVLALGCLLNNKEGIQRILKLSGKEEKKSSLSMFFPDLKTVANYARNYTNTIYRAINRLVPGPYTFIFNANKDVTKYFENKKKEIGVRIPDHDLLQAVLKELDQPIISTSLNGVKFAAFDNDVKALSLEFENDIDLFVDMEGSTKGETTVLDCTGSEIEMIREGIGAIN